MSVQAMSWVFDHSAARLGERLVLLAIANHAREDGSGAWPSVETIALEANLSESAAHRAIRRLEQSGQLVIFRGEGPHGTNIYDMGLSVERGGAKTPPLALTTSRGVASGTRTVLEPLVIEEAFRTFWNLYPRRTGGPKQGKVEFARALREGASIAEIIEGARRFAEDPNLPKDRTKIPHATTWLREGRWGDDPLPGTGEGPPRPDRDGGWDREL